MIAHTETELLEKLIGAADVIEEILERLSTCWDDEVAYRIADYIKARYRLNLPELVAEARGEEVG